MRRKTEAERVASWRDPQWGFAYWMVDLGLLNSVGSPFSWRDRPFLYDPINSTDNIVVVVKPAQLGYSETAFMRCIHRLTQYGQNVFYTLPTEVHLHKFSDTKITPIIKNNPFLRPTGILNKSTISYEKAGAMLMVGTNTNMSQFSLTTPILIHDEANESDQVVLSGMQSRLYSFPENQRQTMYFSNASAPGFGLDSKLSASDLRQWHIICQHCKTEQPLSWFESVDMERKRFRCLKCEHVITDDDRRRGFWKATQQWAGITGFQMNHLMCPWISAAELIRDYNNPESDMERFYRMRLGLPFVNGVLNIDPTILLNAWREPFPAESRGALFMGIDVAYNFLHVVIANLDGAVEVQYLTGTDKWEQADHLMDTRRPLMCVVDNGPADDQLDFQSRYPGKVLRCVYGENDDWDDIWRVDNIERGVVNVHRTRVIDKFIADMGIGNWYWQLDANDRHWRGAGNPSLGARRVANCVLDHFKTLYIVSPDTPEGKKLINKRTGNPVKRWQNNGPDHFAHSSFYAWIARDIGRHYGTGRSMLPGKPVGSAYGPTAPGSSTYRMRR